MNTREQAAITQQRSSGVMTRAPLRNGSAGVARVGSVVPGERRVGLTVDKSSVGTNVGLGVGLSVTVRVGVKAEGGIVGTLVGPSVGGSVTIKSGVASA